MANLKIAFFANQSIITAIEHLRVLGPISYTDMKILMGPKDKTDVFNCIDEAQLVVFHRNLLVDYDLFNHVRSISRKLKKPLVFDIDDNLFDLPEYHPDRKSFVYTKALMPMLEAALTADFITVSNHYLKQNLKDLNQNITVLPNLLDERIWSFRSPKTQKNEGPLILGYMGTKTHQPDLAFIAPTLVEIKQQFPEEIRFHFYGIQPPEALLSFSDTICTLHKTYQYEAFAQDFQQMDVDIFIAPLIDNEFNRCKSAIKFLEYSSLGVPGVYSRVYPYQNTITDGQNGLLADSPEEWGEKIRLLIRNPELRHHLAVNAQESIKDNFLMSENADQWEKTYQRFINKGVVEQKPNQVPQDLIKTITPQLNEFHSDNDERLQFYGNQLNQTREELKNLHNKASALEERVLNLHKTIASRDKEILNLNLQIQNLNLQIQNLNLQIQNLQREIQALKGEVLYYALSKSWQITRPLRKINKLIKGERNA